MNRTRPGRAGFARQDKGRVTKKVDRLAAVVDPRDVAWTLPREYQVSADSRIEEVELVVRPEGDQTAVRPDGPTRNDSARLGVGTNVERLHQSGQRNLTACIRTAPMPSIDGIGAVRIQPVRLRWPLWCRRSTFVPTPRRAESLRVGPSGRTAVWSPSGRTTSSTSSIRESADTWYSRGSVHATSRGSTTAARRSTFLVTRPLS